MCHQCLNHLYFYFFKKLKYFYIIIPNFNFVQLFHFNYFFISFGCLRKYCLMIVFDCLLVHHLRIKFPFHQEQSLIFCFMIHFYCLQDNIQVFLCYHHQQKSFILIFKHFLNCLIILYLKEYIYLDTKYYLEKPRIAHLKFQWHFQNYKQITAYQSSIHNFDHFLQIKFLQNILLFYLYLF